MGCDGGTIPTRDELVRLKKKPEQKDKDAERLYKWQHCNISQEPLTGPPIVACELGRLYAKESVIKMLLDKKDSTNPPPEHAAHIRGLKDVVELELTPNSGYARMISKGPSVGDNYVDRLVAPWICPVTGLEMNGRFKFVFDWSNGKVLSERAYKMVKDDEAVKIAEENMVILNPEDENDLAANETKMEARRARAKALKKASKRAEKEPEGVPSSKKAKVKDSKEKTAKEVPPSSSSSTSTLSVQDDRSKSEVFKSLFSTHKTALNQPRGHWVTFDPRYN